jgi:hypothetical protein
VRVELVTICEERSCVKPNLPSFCEPGGKRCSPKM